MIMADEDEIDILGDFSLSSFSSQNETNILDSTPLVSQNSDLLNCDYTIHPQWLLDKPSANPDNWYETNSAASISDSSETDTLGHISTENYITDESGWTEKEKNLLHRGIEIFGKSSVRLSQFVGSKTSSEVKYYLKNFFSENQNYYQHTSSEALVKNIPDCIVTTEVLDGNQIPASIEEVIAAVSTGSPTVTSTLNKKFRRKSLSNAASISFGPSTSLNRRSPKTKANSNKTKFSEKTTVAKRQIKFKDTKAIFEDKRDQKNIKLKFKTKFKLNAPKIQRKNQKVAKVHDKTVENKLGKAEIITGKGLSVPICDGEEIIKIEHAEDDSSDISIDIENIDEISSTNIRTDALNIDESNQCTNIQRKQADTFDKTLYNMELNAVSSVANEACSDKYFDISQVDKNVAQQLTSLEQPVSELVLDIHCITELEKLVHYEFFEGRSSKTPERYLKEKKSYLIITKRTFLLPSIREVL